MKIRFEGFDNPVLLSKGMPSVLEISNQKLFARICRALMSCDGDNTVEPYSLWDDDETEIKASTVFTCIPNPFALPWEDKKLGGSLASYLNDCLLMENDLRENIEQDFARLKASIGCLTLAMNADYSFDVEWNLGKYLKAFGFKVDVDGEASLLENLIMFMDHAADMSFNGVFVFINLKSFLLNSELESLYERAFFHKLKLLLIENAVTDIRHDHEWKMRIDQHFLEY